MRKTLAIAVCLVGVLWLCGVGIGGSLDMTETPFGDEEVFFNTATGKFETQSAVETFPAPVEKTGQKRTYGTRDDGVLEKGVAWPNPRFKDNGNGTVTDNLTGLIWLKNASCSVFYTGDATGQNDRDWNQALAAANKLKSGKCGLADKSKAGNWRLPNIKELQTLVDFGFVYPAIPNTAGTEKWTEGSPFSGVQSGNYWSSSTDAGHMNNAWYVFFYFGSVTAKGKGSTFYVWPVRGGQ